MEKRYTHPGTMPSDTWGILEQFSVYSKTPASEEARKAFKLVLVKITHDHIQRNGAKGIKKKRALKRFRQYTEMSHKSLEFGMLPMVQEATRLGVPIDTIKTVALLLL